MAKPIDKSWFTAGLGFLLALLLFLGEWNGLFTEFDRVTLDWRQSLPSPQPAKSSENLFALIAIDTISPERPWPWPRLDYALMLQSLLPYSPQSVVFDLPLHHTDTQYSAFDSSFAQLVQRFDRVLFAASVLDAPDDKPLPENLISLSTQPVSSRLPHFESIFWPLDTFASHSHVGVSNLLQESSGKVRLLPLVFQLREKIIPSLTLLAASDLLSGDLTKSNVVLGKAIYLRDNTGHLLRTIPIDAEGRMLLRFRRKDSFWQVSFDNFILYADEMEHGEKAPQNLNELRQRQIWVGRTDRKQEEKIDDFNGLTTPVELQMFATHRIVANDLIRPLPSVLLALIFLSTGFGGGFFLKDYSTSKRSIICTASFAGWLLAAFLFFSLFNLDLPIFSVFLLAVGLYFLGNTFKKRSPKNKAIYTPIWKI